ncbi:hypothetical protein ACFQU2_05965 [Siccirubricoccus deserti]
MINRLEMLTIPTVARLHGGVYGGSTDLALACDFRVGVTPSTVMFMPAARIGVHYYESGLRRYVSVSASTTPSAFSCWPRSRARRSCCGSAT